MITGFVLFFILGLAFGFAMHGLAPWSALLFPVVMALGTMLFVGAADGTILGRLLIALIVTAVGVLLGLLIQQRGEASSAGTG